MISYLSAPSTAGGVSPAISLTDDALKHLNKMRSERKEDLCLRIGVKQGGCSGMSYTMEFESKENARPDDSVMEYNGFVIGKLLSCLFLTWVSKVLWTYIKTFDILYVSWLQLHWYNSAFQHVNSTFSDYGEWSMKFEYWSHV